MNTGKSKTNETAMTADPLLADAPIDTYIEWQKHMKKIMSATMGIPKELINSIPKQIIKSKRKWWYFWRCS